VNVRGNLQIFSDVTDKSLGLPHKRVSFGGEFRASHCNQWGLYYTVVRERRALPGEDLFSILLTHNLFSCCSITLKSC